MAGLLPPDNPQHVQNAAAIESAKIQIVSCHGLAFVTNFLLLATEL